MYGDKRCPCGKRFFEYPVKVHVSPNSEPGRGEFIVSAICKECRAEEKGITDERQDDE